MPLGGIGWSIKRGCAPCSTSEMNLVIGAVLTLPPLPQPLLKGVGLFRLPQTTVDTQTVSLPFLST